MRYDDGRRYDEPESWDGYEEPPPQFAAFAVAGVGVVVLVIAGLLGLPATGWVSKTWLAYGAMLGAALLFWAIGFAVILRKFGSFANIGTLALFAAAGALVVLQLQGVAQRAQLKADLKTLVEIKAGPDGLISVPKDAEKRGPISQASVAFFREINAARQEHDATIAKLGFNRLGDAADVARNPELVRDCGRLDGGKTALQAMRDRIDRAMAKLRQDLAKADIPASLKEGLQSGIEAGFKQGGTRSVRIEGEMVDEAITLCTVLGRHRWMNERGTFMFTSRADLEEYRVHAQRVGVLEAEARQIAADGQARMRQGQQEIARSIR